MILDEERSKEVGMKILQDLRDQFGADEDTIKMIVEASRKLGDYYEDAMAKALTEYKETIPESVMEIMDIVGSKSLFMAVGDRFFNAGFFAGLNSAVDYNARKDKGEIDAIKEALRKNFNSTDETSQKLREILRNASGETASNAS